MQTMRSMQNYLFNIFGLHTLHSSHAYVFLILKVKGKDFVKAIDNGFGIWVVLGVIPQNNPHTLNKRK